MLSIITSTYNRAYILTEAYNSLLNQNDFRFEWIIIDDGSTDNTEELVNSWIENCRQFHITYQRQENSGKHRAVNRAVQLAKYPYCFVLDSDDIMLPSAVELIHKWISTIAHDPSFAGVSGLTGFKNKNEPIGGYISDNFIDAKNNERQKYGLNGDKATVYRTDLLKKYPFPEFENEKFISESSVFDKIAKEGFKIRWFNKIIYEAEYLSDGLSKNSNLERIKNNYNGYAYCEKLFIETHPEKVSHIGEFYFISKKLGHSHSEIRDFLKLPLYKLYLGIFIKSFMNLRNKIKNNKNSIFK